MNTPIARRESAMAGYVGAGTAPSGLTDEQAALALAEHGPNELPRPRPPTLLGRALRQLADPFSIMLLLAGLVTLLVLGEVPEGAAIVAILLVNVIIGVSQEAKADQAVRALRTLTAPMAKVHRAGVTQRVPATQVVPGDLIEVAAGDRVPADAAVIDSASLGVDEATLTGESRSAAKTRDGAHGGDVHLGDRTGELFSGTLVVRGSGTALVERTGAQTEMGRIASALEGRTKGPLEIELAQVSRRIGLVAIVAGVVMVALGLTRVVRGEAALLDIILAGVALAIAAVPESLAAAVTTALALGSQRMAALGLIVRRLSAIEALGATTVIATDKTGTLTTGRLTVVDHVSVDEDGLWAAVLRCNDARDGLGRRSRRRPRDRRERARCTVAARRDPAGDQAVRRRDPLHGRRHRRAAADREGRPRSGARPLRPRPRHGTAGPGRARSHRTGPARARGRPGRHHRSGRGRPAPGRAPGIARRDPPPRPGRPWPTAGRPASAWSWSPATTPTPSRAVAEQVGIHADPVVTGSALTGPDRAARLVEAGVIARVDPATKLDLVRALREHGEIVTMTGDGVNDAPALRHADVGVAMAGDEGTDVAREAAAVVVTNGELGTIVIGVREGRRLRHNVHSMIGYLLAGNLAEIFLVLVGLLVWPDLIIPLLPVHLLWINLVLDGIPAIALGVDRPAGDPLTRPPRRDGLLARPALIRIAGRALVVGALVFVAVEIARRLGWSEEQVRTQAVLALVFARLTLAYVARSRRWTFERGWWHGRAVLIAVIGAAALQTLVTLVPALGALLVLAPLPPIGWLIAVVAAVLTLCCATCPASCPELPGPDGDVGAHSGRTADQR